MIGRALAMLFAAALLAGCGQSDPAAPREPAGTPTDPVEVCKRIADVCRLDRSRLGVCIAAPAANPPAECAGRTPCFLCVSQH